MAQQTGTAQLTLIVGDESVLVERAIEDALAGLRGDGPAEVVTVDPETFGATDLSVLLSPSLFGDRQIVVIRGVQDLPADDAKRLVALLADVVPEVSVIVVHAGGQKGRALVKTIGDLAGARVDVPKVTKYRERLDFVQSEISRRGGTTTESAARALLEGVGSDLAALAMACAQLVADTGGNVDVDAVTRYHAVPAEVTGFAVADAAVDGDVAGALSQLRWALTSGVSPVLVTSALASGVRQVAKVASAGRTARAAELSRELGMPPWKVERAQRQARGWHPDGIATALAAVADADAAVKGAGVDPAYALERAVLTITAARGPA
ncbi:MAG: DNA polymerase III subunit delta [Actinomycetes bacterium]